VKRVAFGLVAVAWAALLGAAAPAPAEPGNAGSNSTVQVGSVNAHAGVELTVIEAGFVRAINVTRRKRGLAPLKLNHDLVRAARFHSADMVDGGHFEHGPASRRLTRFGVKTGTVGENIGWSSSRESAVPMIVEMWLRSPPHRAVLLSRQFRAIGVGVGIGRFKGSDGAIVVTADFWSE
jgi:uncharacterized protein YkwD